MVLTVAEENPSLQSLQSEDTPADRNSAVCLVSVIGSLHGGKEFKHHRSAFRSFATDCFSISPNQNTPKRKKMKVSFRVSALFLRYTSRGGGFFNLIYRFILISDS